MTKPWIGYAIIVSAMMGVIAVIFVLDINPLRKPVKQDEVVQVSRGVVEKSATDGNMEDVRDVVRFLSNTLKSLEKERIIQSIPELPELGKQFGKTINSWGTHTNSVSSEQSTGVK